MPDLKGSCHCGAVTFTLTQVPTEPTACHCTQCRKQSGHYLASAKVPKTAVNLTGADHMSWYRSSEKVRRGFCSKCGSWLFWEPLLRDSMWVALGSLDGKTGLTLERHIYVADKGDYYTIADGLPQNEN